MRFWFASALACGLLMADSMAVSSLGDVTVVKPARARAIAHASVMPLMLLVSRDGAPLGGVALTAQ